MTPGIQPFGVTATGQPVERIAIGEGPLSAAILTLGGFLQDVRLDGIGHSLTVGSPDLSAYAGPLRYAGAIVGPVANRIAGAQALIDGTPHRFDANQAGRHMLHGGAHGLNTLIWTLTDNGPAHAELTVDLPDGAGGFPGNRTITARYEADGATLRLTLTAITDAPTLITLANHSFWRLDDAPSTKGQTLRIAADRYLPTDADLIPTGEIAPVQGTRFDFRDGRKLQGGAEGLIDTNFCLSLSREPLRPVATLTAQSGVSMALATTEPGLQVFDGHNLGQAAITGHDPAPYAAYAALAMEPQFWPDAPHHPDFPDITLRPGALWEQVTTWTFRA